ncbi:ComF family protein [Candidatus Uhrbacteria bacterium]|nr:ComF family protein [Candidatus Uhrbacteria bacterium]
MRILVTRLKYQSASCLIPAIKHVIERSGYRVAGDAAVTWVPASKKRLAERGLDHARAIAQVLSPNALPLLERARHTLTNATLEQHELREGNVVGAFRAIHPIPEHVILVDDVRTSGATASACAKVLRENGAKNVDLVTLAYGG